MMNKAIIAAVVLVVVFLAGLVPQYVKVNHLDAESRQARQTSTSAELRDLAGLQELLCHPLGRCIRARRVAARR